MLLLLMLAATGEVAPPVDVKSPPASFDLQAVGRRHRLPVLPDLDADETRRNPLSVSAIEDERQRLRVGVRPGSSRARFGLDYRLTLGR